MTSPAKTSTIPADDNNEFALAGFDALIGTQMRYAYFVMKRSFSMNIEPLGLTQTQCATMWILHANPAMSQTELAKSLDVDRITMIGVIDKLRTRGLINRLQSATDGRRYNLFLSEKGETLFSKVKEELLANDKQFTDLFSPGELLMLMEGLRKIYTYAEANGDTIS